MAVLRVRDGEVKFEMTRVGATKGENEGTKETKRQNIFNLINKLNSTKVRRIALHFT